MISGCRPQKGQANHALQATAAALFTFDVSWFIGCLLCAQALPSAAVPELGRSASFVIRHSVAVFGDAHFEKRGGKHVRSLVSQTHCADRVSARFTVFHYVATIPVKFVERVRPRRRTTRCTRTAAPLFTLRLCFGFHRFFSAPPLPSAAVGELGRSASASTLVSVPALPLGIGGFGSGLAFLREDTVLARRLFPRGKVQSFHSGGIPTLRRGVPNKALLPMPLSLYVRDSYSFD